MMLFTKDILKKIPTLDASSTLGIDDQKVWVKLFNPTGGQTWYITAYTPAEKMAFGFVNLGDAEMAELGYISMDEIEKFRGRFGLPIERDRGFEPMPLRQVMDTIKNGGHI